MFVHTHIDRDHMSVPSHVYINSQKLVRLIYVHVHLVSMERPAGAETTVKQEEDDTPQPDSERSGIMMSMVMQ